MPAGFIADRAGENPRDHEKWSTEHDSCREARVAAMLGSASGGRSGARATRRTARDLSMTAIVAGCVALAVAAIVGPVTSRVARPAGERSNAAVSAEGLTSSERRVAVELRPGIDQRAEQARRRVAAATQEESRDEGAFRAVLSLGKRDPARRERASAAAARVAVPPPGAGLAGAGSDVMLASFDGVASAGGEPVALELAGSVVTETEPVYVDEGVSALATSPIGFWGDATTPPDQGQTVSSSTKATARREHGADTRAGAAKGKSSKSATSTKAAGSKMRSGETGSGDRGRDGARESGGAGRSSKPGR